MDENKARYAQKTDARTLVDLLPGADVFLGLSAGKVLKPEWLPLMAARPLILALANPEPEIMPDIAKAARPDAVIATGRSDFPNQVNNVLCFPFIFRGALDVGATTVNEAMKLATVRALADLAMAEQSDIVAQAYGVENLRFGPEYLIPKPFDPRLIVTVATAVAKAAMGSGVATRPITDFDAYRQKLEQFVYHSGLLMKPIFTAAKKEPKRIVYAEGEDERVLRAVQVVVDEALAKPILVGRPAVLERRIQRFGLRLKAGTDFEVINPEFDPRYKSFWAEYYRLTSRKGVSQEYAQIEMRRRHTLIGAMTVHMGDADGMLCGTFGSHHVHLNFVDQVIGQRKGGTIYAAMNAVLLPSRTVFIADTYVNADPTAEEIASIALLAAEEIRRFGMTPKVALLVALELRQQHPSAGEEDAAGAGADQRRRSPARGRRRNARRRGVVGRGTAASAARIAVEGRGQPAHHADRRRRQHRVQPAQGGVGRQRHAGADTARRRAAGAHPDAVGDGAADRQHDRAYRGRRAGGAAVAADLAVGASRRVGARRWRTSPPGFASLNPGYFGVSSLLSASSLTQASSSV